MARPRGSHRPQLGVAALLVGQKCLDDRTAAPTTGAISSYSSEFRDFPRSKYLTNTGLTGKMQCVEF